MASFSEMTDDQLAAEVARLEAEADRLRGLGLSLDMTRGKPCPDQINLSKPMFDLFDHDSDLTDGGFDAGNYGCPQGLPSARRFFGEMLGVDPDLVFIGGCSSLNIMFDIVTHCFTHGLRGNTPWSELPEVKFLCPSPGYDRHFGVSEYFGFTNVAIPMHDDGPDMDEVERLVEGDPTVKGIWCVPKYQNPMGITFSDEVVRRFAALRPAAPDFRVFWDNAYGVHDFNDTPDQLLNIFEAMRQAGTDDLVFEFASTSKVTFPGSGMGCVVCNAEDLADIRSGIAAERVCDNKLSQLMSIRFIPDMAALKEHMAKQAEIVRPHFELVEKKLSEGLADVEGVRWTHPNGGYFVSFDGPEGTAKAIVGLAADLGVKMTGAGATWPYHHDPADSNIRIAPTFPPIEDLDQALDVFVTCVRLVCAQRELQRRNR